MNKCPTCNQPTATIRSIIKHGNILTGCDNCLPQQLQQGDSAAFERHWQKIEYRRDITQPNQPEFARAYPEEFRKLHGDELYRKMG
jgi:hypothetical protein